ncbi:MAG: nucleotidyltransferase domain-containing protein [Candidatus Omnitrophota bacterium]|jgi:predicted nucleotidyltransferase|nr:MAG: nucleotidyltransferase domain-containing protein [Candidatus Omnitrophota bacterium]
MRLSEDERQWIKQSVCRLDPQAQIWLFGSRVSDREKGGDIDLLILSDRLTFADKLEIKRFLFERMDEQKIDIVISSPDKQDPFMNLALENSVRL